VCKQIARSWWWQSRLTLSLRLQARYTSLKGLCHSFLIQPYRLGRLQSLSRVFGSADAVCEARDAGHVAPVRSEQAVGQLAISSEVAMNEQSVLQ
jgi:hypothetical protein